MDEQPKSLKRSTRRQFVDQKLIFRLRLFAVIFLVMVIIIGYDSWLGYIDLWKAILGLALGVVIGFIMGRTFNVTWHEEASKAISKMDLIGGVILVAYIIFALLRKKIISHWLKGHELSAFVLCLSAGIMFGRLVSLRAQLVKVLKQQGKI